MKEYLTIKEFATLFGVEPSTLRYWEEIGIFSPVYRNPENNYRYYSPAQFSALHFITTLSDLNFPLKAIADMDNNRTPKNFVAKVDAQVKMLDREIERLRTCYSIIHERRDLVNFGLEAGKEQIAVLYREHKPMLLGPRNEYEDGETYIDALTKLIPKAKNLHMNLSFPICGYYDDMASFVAEPKRPHHFFTIDPLGTQSREPGDYLVGFTHGNYYEFGGLPERMVAYAAENSVEISGPVYAIYLFDELCAKDPNQYLVKVCIAASK